MTPRSRKAITPKMAQALEALYLRYNRPEYIDPDPLAPTKDYAHSHDQEVAGLIAASLAFGNVKTILKSIDAVLRYFPNPAADLRTATTCTLKKRLRGFRHRYTDETDMLHLLQGIQQVLNQYDSLGHAFQLQINDDDASLNNALQRWRALLMKPCKRPGNYLLPDPAKTSACKRLHMYLRWMVRNDAVDPGPWSTHVSAAKLLYPMDTHMHRIATCLGITKRKCADRCCAEEVTAQFARVAPHDPVRYDFCLTRLGIRKDTDLNAFLIQCGKRVSKN